MVDRGDKHGCAHDVQGANIRVVQIVSMPPQLFSTNCKQWVVFADIGEQAPHPECDQTFLNCDGMLGSPAKPACWWTS